MCCESLALPDTCSDLHLNSICHRDMPHSKCFIIIKLKIITSRLEESIYFVICSSVTFSPISLPFDFNFPLWIEVKVHVFLLSFCWGHQFNLIWCTFHFCYTWALCASFQSLVSQTKLFVFCLIIHVLKKHQGKMLYWPHSLSLIECKLGLRGVQIIKKCDS